MSRVEASLVHFRVESSLPRGRLDSTICCVVLFLCYQIQWLCWFPRHLSATSSPSPVPYYYSLSLSAHRWHHRQGTWFGLLPSQADIKFMSLTININLAMQKYEPKSFRTPIDEATALFNEHFPTVLLSTNISSPELLSLLLISSSIRFWIQCTYHLSSVVTHSSRQARQSFSPVFRLVRVRS